MKARFTLVCLFLALFSGCATTNKNPNVKASNDADFKCKPYYCTAYNTLNYDFFAKKSNLGKELGLLDYVNTRIGVDCSGLVSVINDKNDNLFFDTKDLVAHFSSGRKSQAIFDLYKSQEKIFFSSPNPGDLVFFNNTTKRTKGGKQKLITHIGVITDVGTNGQIEFLHNIGGKNVISAMNLNNPNTHKIGNKKINAYLISRCKTSSCLASNRFSGFGRVVAQN